MTSLESPATSEWNGIERRIDGGYPSRIAIILDPDFRGLKVRNTVAEEGLAPSPTAQGERLAGEPDSKPRHDA